MQTWTGIDDLVLDPRGAAFLKDHRILAVADLHLGYAWAQRARGALLPVESAEDAAERLGRLVDHHRPCHVVILGDVVHRALDLPAMETALRDLRAAVPAGVHLTFCLGNHDRHLDRLLVRLHLGIEWTPVLRVGRFTLCHGDTVPPEPPLDLEPSGQLTLLGHEHPCLILDDGAATSARVPCFLVAEDRVVLPAFSKWAAGCPVCRGPFLGLLAQQARFHTVVACLGGRVLELPWAIAAGGVRRPMGPR